MFYTKILVTFDSRKTEPAAVCHVHSKVFVLQRSFRNSYSFWKSRVAHGSGRCTARLRKS